MKIDKEELNDCIDVYLQDVIDWSMSEWIADQLCITTEEVDSELEKNSTYKKLKKLLD